MALEALKTELDKKNIALLRAASIGHCKDMVSVPFGAFVNVEGGILKF
jgi:muramoyltetrapeptide carboxypeptidase LdcA involved in peptidoglycan recycling